MKKISKILESFVSDKQVTETIGKLGETLVYKLGMRKIIEGCLQPFYSEVNYNTDPKYQFPLSLLFHTGKFPDIKNYDTKYWTPKLKMRLVFRDGVWHPINKLNTNSFDQALLLTDVFRVTGKLDEVKNNLYPQENLVSWLQDFLSKNNILQIMKKHQIKIGRYIEYNRIFSAKGEKAEGQVADYLQTLGYKILYRGGDGDPIDMNYGCDLIISEDDKIFTVQVKTSEDNARKAVNKKMYSGIDIFYWCDDGKIGSIKRT